jgi:Zn-finger nucleic acid-binding protein
MKCPVDDETLVMTDRNGVEIDYCPKCRGVWLDRGELDKIIERAVPDATKDSVRHFPQDRQDIGRSSPNCLTFSVDVKQFVSSCHAAPLTIGSRNAVYQLVVKRLHADCLIQLWS